MQKSIAYLLLVVLLGMTSPLLPAQQNQNPQKSDSEIKLLEKRVSELEKQLQTVENVEKMDLQAKLAEANAKLADAEFGKFKRELKDSNEEWLRGWSSWFLGIFLAIIAIFVAILLGVSRVFWFWLKSEANRLITDTVERSINGFKEAVEAQDVIKDQLKVLEKERAVSVLDRMFNLDSTDYPSPKEIERLREETLLQVLSDEEYRMAYRCKAAEVLAHWKKSPQLVSPTLEILNSLLGSDIDSYPKSFVAPKFIKFLKQVPTPAAYQGLTKILDRLLIGNPKDKDSFLTQTVSSLTGVGIKLDIGDSVPILRRAISHLKVTQLEREDLSDLAGYFDRFNESKGIKEILTNHVRDKIPGFTQWQKHVEDRCLELLQKHDPEFVKEWRTRETTTDNSNT